MPLVMRPEMLSSGLAACNSAQAVGPNARIQRPSIASRKSLEPGIPIGQIYSWCTERYVSADSFSFWAFQTFSLVELVFQGVPMVYQFSKGTPGLRKDYETMSLSVSAPSAIDGFGELQGFPPSRRKPGFASPKDSLVQNLETSEAVTPRVGRPRKPGAKSRDTARYRAWTGYLMRDTVTEAEYELKRTNPDGTRDKRDMSDLIQNLLAGWLAERKKIVR